MTLLAYVDIVLAFVAAGLWGGYWWMIRSFPEVPLLERWSINPSYRPQTVQQQVQSAPYLGAYYASATSILIPPHWTREDDL